MRFCNDVVHLLSLALLELEKSALLRLAQQKPAALERHPEW
jgi:hypothetical protein